jgi:hypothetical protein
MYGARGFDKRGARGVLLEVAPFLSRVETSMCAVQLHASQFVLLADSPAVTC